MFQKIVDMLTKSTYTVCVSWEEKDFTHVTHSYEDALEWMACYPVGVEVCVYAKGKLIVSRY